MFITYNGINLSLTSLDNVDRETVFSDDGSTVLYTEITLSVSATYAPPIGGIPQVGGTSVGGTLRNTPQSPAIQPPPRNPQDVRGKNPGGMATGGSSLQPQFPNLKTSGSNPSSPTSCSLPDPGSGGWKGPITTDRELELLLRTPRQKLIVWAFNENNQPVTWIESPRQQDTTDAKTGPVVLNCSVKGGPNGNSFFVALDIRTWLTPCEDASDRPLLSHRWSMTHTEDENHYLTRIVTGEAVFNLGVMHATEQSPDWFRKQLFHPIPLGFQRSLGPITISQDGTTLAYQYFDTDTTCVFDPSDTGAVHMDISESVKYHNPWRGLS